MRRTIKKAAVLGAGVMGSAIATHMANAGLEVCLLDMVPPDAQHAKEPAARNKLAVTGLEKALKSEPPAFYVPENATLIATGNFEDNLSCVADADWVIEAVVEDLETKRQLLRKIQPLLQPETIVSTNTSGLSVNKIAEALKKTYRRNFLGTHFFNPPRYMKLIEIIPGETTNKRVVRFISDFCESRLGKRVVLAKDTPNFIANRLGIHNYVFTIKTMLAAGYTIEEVDAITGPPLGRPKSATFRTLDIVGLDTFLHIVSNFAGLTDPSERDELALPPLIDRMVREGLTGDKKGKGFYRKGKTAQGSQTYSLDYTTFQYVPQRRVELPVLDALKKGEDPARRLAALVYSDDRAGRLAWKVIKRLLLYSASKIPEIADGIVSVDLALKWGFNHELGPFEIWDAIGVRKSVERMAAEGEPISPNVTAMLRRGKERFYERQEGKTFFFDFRSGDYREIGEAPRVILLPSLKERQKLVKSNAGASLIDIGRGVVCLEFHSPNNTVDADVLQMLDFAIDEAANNWEGLVIGNHGRNFCAGVDLSLVLAAAQNREWDKLDAMVRRYQDSLRKLRFSERPVVAAPFRMTPGAGCELCLASARVRAAAETYIGLVEAAAGLVPVGGGCKEMLVRGTAGIPASVISAMPGAGQPGLIPFVSRVFETINTAKVSTSAPDARAIGYLSCQDKITMNQDYLLHDAREDVLALARDGHRPPRPRDDIRVTGRTGLGALEAIIYILKEGNFISEHDALVAGKVAAIITGGNLPQNTLVTEDYLLDLERESFLSLCGEEKTQARMQALLQTGRPVRN